MGFKTVVCPTSRCSTATPASVKVTLEVGELEETVVVTGATEIVQTQSANGRDDDRGQADPAAAGHHAHGARLRRQPAGRRDGRQQHPRVDDQRPADHGDQHHAGRHQRAGQAGLRRLLHVHPADDGLGRGNHRLDVEPGRRGERRRAAVIRMETRSGSNRFSGSVYNTWRNQAGTNDDDGIARKNKGSWLWGLNTPYWFNKRDMPEDGGGRLLHQRRPAADARLPRGRADHQGQVVLLLQLRGVPAARVAQPHPLPAEPDGAGGHLHLHRRRRHHADGQPADAGGGQRPDVHAGPVHRQAAGRHPDGAGDDRGRFEATTRTSTSTTSSPRPRRSGCSRRCAWTTTSRTRTG